MTDWSHIKANPRKPDERDILLGAVAAPAGMPPGGMHVDLSWLVRNFQGKTFFCGEHAGTHLKAILDYVTSGGTAANRFTPRYGAIKMKDPNSTVYDGFAIDAGTDMRCIFKWLQKVGADTFEPLENDVTLPGPTYCDPSAVTPAMDANAATSKISNYGFGNTDFASLCQYAWMSKAVLLLIKCDDGFWGTSEPTFTTPTYGHFVTMYDYDQNGIWVIDSAEPVENFALKHIATEYIVPEFILESGTAVDLPPSAQAVIADPTVPPATKPQIVQAILSDIAQAVALIRQELGSL
jgi:hypothetical protein